MKNNTDKFLKTSTLTKPTRTTLKAPFAWVGGKNYLAKEIIALMPEHKSYIEVFGGALSVFYQKSASKIEVINDINDELINLHLCIRNKPQSLANVLNSMIISRKIFHMLKNKEIKPRNDLERAAFYFYLISTSFGSSMGQFAMSKQRAPKRLCRDFSLLLELINKTHKITTLNSISHLKILNLNKKFPYKNDDLNLYVKIFNIFSFL